MTNFYQPPTKPITIEIALQPVHNTLWAISLLTPSQPLGRSENWLTATTKKLTAEQKALNRLIFTYLGGALLPSETAVDFPTYLAELNEITDTELKRGIDPDQLPFFEEALSKIDTAPAAGLAQLVYQHLHTLWHDHFAPEWQKKLYRMNTFLPSLQSRPWPTDSAAVAIRAFLRRNVPDEIIPLLRGVEKVIFCPSPFMQIQGARFGHDKTVWIFVYADPWVLPMRYEPIQRSEVLRVLNALADETRLQILERLALDEMVRAQTLIDKLDVSQPTVSRHLKLLKNSQWVYEERSGADASKLYRLNRERVSTFAHALQTLLSADNARIILQDVREDVPAELRPFLNSDGQVVNWSSKRKAQQAILHYLRDKIMVDKEYTEREVTDLLDQWLVHVDAVHIRRELIDAHYLIRTKNGSRYWRQTDTDT